MTKSSVFDPFDRTTQQTSKVGTSAAKITRFVYLGVTDQVVSEEQKDAAGVWKVAKSYTYGPGGERLSLVDTPVDGTAGSTSYYGTNPHTDTETLTSESTGQTTATYRYTAYGTADQVGTTGVDKVENEPVKDADVVNPYRFNGKRFDGATGSYDMGFRDYSPGLNRFTTRDMYNGALADVALGTDPWNTNRYAFAGGNPVSGIELDGHRPTCIAEGTCGTGSTGMLTGVQAPNGTWPAVSQPAADGDFGDWLGGVGDRVLEAASDSTPALKMLPGEHPYRMLSDGLNEALDADTSTGAYRRGQGAADLSMLAGTLLTLGGTSAAAGAPLAAERFIQTARATRAANSAAPMDSFLANGATVQHSATATSIGDDANTLQNFLRSRGAAGHDVIVHGDRQGNFRVNGMITNPHQIAEAILDNPRYTPGTPINLVTCHGACGAAQELQEIMGVPVHALENLVDLHPRTGLLRDLG